jgi:glutathione peroxidase-family protein
MRRQIIVAISLLAISAVVLTSCKREEPAPAEAGKKAPAFTLKGFDGKEVSLSDYTGKIVVLEWFNDECPFVKYHYEKAYTMVELATRYRDKNVVWLAVNSTNHTTPEQNKALAELTAGKSVSTASTKPYGCNVKYAK